MAQSPGGGAQRQEHWGTLARRRGEPRERSKRRNPWQPRPEEERIPRHSQPEEERKNPLHLTRLRLGGESGAPDFANFSVANECEPLERPRRKDS